VLINGTRIVIMIRQSLSYASRELYPKTLSSSFGLVASRCGGRGQPHTRDTPPGSVYKDRGTQRSRRHAGERGVCVCLESGVRLRGYAVRRPWPHAAASP